MRAGRPGASIRLGVEIMSGGAVRGPADKLRLLAESDTMFIASEIAAEPVGGDTDRLGDKTRDLVRLGALVAVDAPQAAYSAIVARALDAGATEDDLIDTLIAVTPSVGITRVVAAAPKLAVALGFDIEAALEA
jgi:alkylhydroperoxidase/carboxymuconolactone decarboxylase family protein YurZ